MKYKINSNYFDKITQKNCTVAGFIAADGYIYKNKPTLTLGISEKDETLLDQIKVLMGSNHRIYHYKNYSPNPEKHLIKSVLNINNKKIINDLYKNFNINTNKSLTYTPPIFKNKKYEAAFLKGLLIGDGWVTIKSRKCWDKSLLEIGICGSKEQCLFLKNFRDKYYPNFSNRKTANIRKRLNKECYQYTVAGQSAFDILKCLNKIKGLHLNRKFDKLKDFNTKGQK